MEHKMNYNSNDWVTNVALGTIGGMIKLFMIMDSVIPFSTQLLQAGITAITCGFLGWIGGKIAKVAWVIISKIFKKS